MAQLRGPYTADDGVTHTVELEPGQFEGDYRYSCSCGKTGAWKDDKAKAISGGRQHISLLMILDGKQPDQADDPTMN
jgi:hypothetical protein